MKRTLAPLALVFALVVIAPAAFAATANNTLTVQASVAANCTISSATLDFGAYDPVVANAATDATATATMNVACTKNVNPSVGFAAAGGTINGGGSSLSYTLWQDAGHLTAFGPSGTGLKSLGAAPSKAARPFTIFGVMPQGQDVPVASYTGTIQATVNF